MANPSAIQKLIELPADSGQVEGITVLLETAAKYHLLLAIDSKRQHLLQVIEVNK